MFVKLIRVKCTFNEPIKKFGTRAGGKEKVWATR